MYYANRICANNSTCFMDDTESEVSENRINQRINGDSAKKVLIADFWARKKSLSENNFIQLILNTHILHTFLNCVLSLIYLLINEDLSGIITRQILFMIPVNIAITSVILSFIIWLLARVMGKRILFSSAWILQSKMLSVLFLFVIVIQIINKMS